MVDVSADIPFSDQHQSERAAQRCHSGRWLQWRRTHYRSPARIYQEMEWFGKIRTNQTAVSVLQRWNSVMIGGACAFQSRSSRSACCGCSCCSRWCNRDIRCPLWMRKWLALFSRFTSFSRSFRLPIGCHPCWLELPWIERPWLCPSSMVSIGTRWGTMLFTLVEYFTGAFGNGDFSTKKRRFLNVNVVWWNTRLNHTKVLR